jgi:hypothetical protein
VSCALGRLPPWAPRCLAPRDIRRYDREVVRARTAPRLLVIVLAASAFGAAMSVLKGNDAGIRDDIGNLSAPWLLLPFFAGAAVRQRDLGAAAAGLAATVAALVTFYVANAFVLDLGPHSLMNDLRLTVGATGYWLPRGLVSGPVFGALGGLWRRRGYPTLGVAVLLLLDAEPLFWTAAHRAGGVASFDFQPSLAASIVESLVGLATAVCILIVVRRGHRAAALAATNE